MNSNKLPISNFELNTMCPHPNILIIGKRGTGKRELILEMLEYFQKKHPINLNIVSPLDRLAPFYKEKYPNSNIVYDLNKDFISRILSEATENISKDIHTILVLDDCISHHNMISDQAVQEVLMNGH